MGIKTGQVRIIGGKWRGYKLRFPAIAQLRPTPDPVKETLFNWLEPVINEAKCLDLFAGSGSLGFEALSRGAKKVSFVDRSYIIKSYLENQFLRLAIVPEQAVIIIATFPFNGERLALEGPFDIIFLDPPFTKGFISSCCKWVIQFNLLAEQGQIYIESESEFNINELKSWEIVRQKTTGKVKYTLLRRAT